MFTVNLANVGEERARHTINTHEIRRILGPTLLGSNWVGTSDSQSVSQLVRYRYRRSME